MQFFAWEERGRRFGWTAPRPATFWLRLPLVRHIRTIWHRIGVARHEAAWASVGMASSGYDHWMLFGMWRGWV